MHDGARYSRYCGTLYHSIGRFSLILDKKYTYVYNVSGWKDQLSRIDITHEVGQPSGCTCMDTVSESCSCNALGYASEEWINGRTPSFGKAMMHGGFVALEGMVNFGVGGIVGCVGNVGTKGKFLVSKEWWGKLVLGLEFTQPFKLLVDYIRNNI